MHQSHRFSVAATRSLLLVWVACGLSACVFAPVEQTVPRDQARVEAKASTAKSTSHARVHVKPRLAHSAHAHKVAKARPKRAVPPKPVAVVLADDDSRFKSTLPALKTQLAKRGFDVISAHGVDAQDAVNSIKPGRRIYAVAVGSEAAAIGAHWLNLPTVYCEVDQPHLGGLLNVHGVDALPPLALQLKAWKRISPRLNRVALILGPGRSDTAAEARAAAKSLHVKLIVRRVSSDQEAMYVFKRLAPAVDGLWLLPDSVLSPRAIRAMLHDATHYKVQSLAFTPSLFRWGALLSVGSTPRNVALTVADVLDQLATKPHAVPESTPLSALEVRVNETMAAQFGLRTSSPSWVVREGGS